VQQGKGEQEEGKVQHEQTGNVHFVAAAAVAATSQDLHSARSMLPPFEATSNQTATSFSGTGDTQIFYANL